VFICFDIVTVYQNIVVEGIGKGVNALSSKLELEIQSTFDKRLEKILVDLDL